MQYISSIIWSGRLGGRMVRVTRSGPKGSSHSLHQAGHPAFHALPHDLRYELPDHLTFLLKKYEMRADRKAEQDLVRPAINR